MFTRRCLPWCVALAVAMFVVGVAQAITIDLVTVGNAGNASDTRYNGISVGGVAKDYAIGKYEITAGQYRDFLNAVATTDTYGLYNPSMDSGSWGCQITRHGTSGSYTYNFSGRPSGTESDWANRPVNYVSWGDAARFANWLHNNQPFGAQGLTTTEDGAYYLDGATTNAVLMAVTRKADAKWWIPSEDEWYKAAYHKNDGVTGNYWDYPTSSNNVPSNDLINPDPGNNATFYISGGDHTIGSPYWTTVVGEFENSDSPYGTFDQGGNVWEWNETVISAGSSRGLRGGHWWGYSNRLAASYRTSNDTTYEDYYQGFRVASVPEPGSIALLAVGALGLLAYAWRRRNVR